MNIEKSEKPLVSYVQIGLLFLACGFLFFAAINWWTIYGLILWRVALAILLLDIVTLLIWPPNRAQYNFRGRPL